MTDALSLAARLARLDDDALGTVIAERVVGRHRIGDFFDLAEALLDQQAVQRALAPLDRDTLTVLATVAVAPRSTPSELAARVAELAGSLAQ